MKGQTYRAGIAGLDQEVEGTHEIEISMMFSFGRVP